MHVMRQAAFCVQRQHIIWQQVIINLKDTSSATPLSKGWGPAKIRCIPFKKVINGNHELLGLRGCRGRPDQRGGLYRIEFGPAFVEIRLTLLGDLILFRTSAVPILVVRSEEHTSELQSQSNILCRLLLD